MNEIEKAIVNSFKLLLAQRVAISLFDTEFVFKGLFSKELSKDLHDIFNLRQVSDYQIIGPVTSKDAETTLKRAAGFVEAVSENLMP